MLNEVNLMGRLTKDPELRRTESGVAVTSFRIAVERDTKAKDAERPETDFFDCVAWRSTAEFIEKFFVKGRMIVVHGKLRQRGYTTKEGERRQTVEVKVANVYFGDSKKSNESGDTDSAQYVDNPSENNYETIEDEDAQLPFLLRAATERYHMM